MSLTLPNRHLALKPDRPRRREAKRDHNTPSRFSFKYFYRQTSVFNVRANKMPHGELRQERFCRINEHPPLIG
jgi:hypothetical protein